MSSSGKPDNWSSEAYSKAAAFVPALAQKVQKYLAPQHGETILDIGCGDGKLTAELAIQVGPSGKVVGLDSSHGMISAAQAADYSGCSFHEHDCGRLEASTLQQVGLNAEQIDAIFSSAAMHWILRSQEARDHLFKDALAAVKPGGRFVFEMGGAGNVAEAHAALRMALRHRGRSLEQIDALDPWFFASESWMRKALEAAGWHVELVESEYRPTKLTAPTGQGQGGLEGWVRLMGASFVEGLPDDERETVISDVCEAVQRCVERDDGTQVLGYVRLRGIAKRRS